MRFFPKYGHHTANFRGKNTLRDKKSSQVEKAEPSFQTATDASWLQVGDEVSGKIASIRKDFAWVKITNGQWGKLPASALVLGAMEIGNDSLFAADIAAVKEDHGGRGLGAKPRHSTEP